MDIGIALLLILIIVFVIYPIIYYAVKNAILDAYETIKKQEENLEPTIDE